MVRHLLPLFFSIWWLLTSDCVYSVSITETQQKQGVSNFSGLRSTSFFSTPSGRWLSSVPTTVTTPPYHTARLLLPPLYGAIAPKSQRLPCCRASLDYSTSQEDLKLNRFLDLKHSGFLHRYQFSFLWLPQNTRGWHILWGKGIHSSGDLKASSSTGSVLLRISKTMVAPVVGACEEGITSQNRKPENNSGLRLIP